jgi:RluA family pseudouridine synthase
VSDRATSDLLSRVLFRDGLMLIIDKPAGIAVHPGPKGGPNLQDLLDQLRYGLPRRPELAHRLDRDTSGCLVLGRHRKALQKLGRLFSGGRVEKVYWAIVVGAPPAPSGRIEIALSKRSNIRGWWMKADPTGQPAITDYRVLGRAPAGAWLELKPLTGRTHQIRVHLAELGCPVLGDPVYRPTMQPDPRPPLHLHARRVVVPLYPKREPIAATAVPPPHMTAALAAAGYVAGAPS